MFVRRQTRWGWEPLLSGAEMPGAVAVLVPCSGWRQSGCLLDSRAAAWCRVGAAVSPNLPGGEGDTISPSLMARQGQTPLAQEHPVQRDVKIEAGGQQGAMWEQNAEPERPKSL